MPNSDHKENKSLITSHTHPKEAQLKELAKIPAKMGFQGNLEGGSSSIEPRVSYETELNLKIMMQDSVESIEKTFDAFLQKNIGLAKAFEREDIVELLAQHQVKNKNKLRPKNPT